MKTFGVGDRVQYKNRAYPQGTVTHVWNGGIEVKFDTGALPVSCSPGLVEHVTENMYKVGDFVTPIIPVLNNISGETFIAVGEVCVVTTVIDKDNCRIQVDTTQRRTIWHSVDLRPATPSLFTKLQAMRHEAYAKKDMLLHENLTEILALLASTLNIQPINLPDRELPFGAYEDDPIL